MTRNSIRRTQCWHNTRFPRRPPPGRILLNARPPHAAARASCAGFVLLCAFIKFRRMFYI